MSSTYDDRRLLRVIAQRDEAWADNQRLRSALRGLMDALVMDEEGNVFSTPEEWGDAWCEAVKVLDAALAEEAS